MSKRARLYKKIVRLEQKLVDVQVNLENARTEYNYWVSMEDDSSDWEA